MCTYCRCQKLALLSVRQKCISKLLVLTGVSLVPIGNIGSVFLFVLVLGFILLKYLYSEF